MPHEAVGRDSDWTGGRVGHLVVSLDLACQGEGSGESMLVH